MNKSLIDYANEIDNNSHITFYGLFRTLLKGLDCVICLESACDLLGYSNGGYRNKIEIYTTKNLDLPYVNCHLVESLKNIPTQSFNELKVTILSKTINDLLSNSNSDDQIIYETLANYYFKNNKSFSNLKILPTLQEKFNKYSNEAIQYYNSN